MLFFAKKDVVLTINARTFLQCYFLLIYLTIFWQETVQNAFSQMHLKEDCIYKDEHQNL